MNCQRFEISIDDYLDDRLDDENRRAFRRHLQSCARCGAVAADREPSLLLISRAPLETDAQAVTECAETVTALIRQERLRRRLVPRSRPWLAAAAACVIVLGGGLLWRLAPRGVEPLPTAVAVAESEGPTVDLPPPPTVEIEMPSSEVRVYQFADSADETTAVYFVVNEAMEL